MDARCEVCKHGEQWCDMEKGCEKWRVFDDWSSTGRKILKGSKATKRNGENMFHISQTGRNSAENYMFHEGGWQSAGGGMPLDKRIYHNGDFDQISMEVECPINM